MKRFLLPVFGILMVYSCQKESIQVDQSNFAVLTSESRNEQITICHLTGQGNYQALTINQNALAGHLAHGDYLPDADNDGYSAVGACTGSMNDCDDHNAAIHPGAEEVCGNDIDDNCNGEIDEDCCMVLPCFSLEDLENKAPFQFYYDSKVRNCRGYDEMVYVKFAGGFVFAVSAYGPKFVVYEDETTSCTAVVGQDISLNDYRCTLAGLREFIAAHSEIPNFCDLYFPGGGKMKPLEQEERLIARTVEALRLNAVQEEK